jgi:hypothetical protein
VTSTPAPVRQLLGLSEGIIKYLRENCEVAVEGYMATPNEHTYRACIATESLALVLTEKVAPDWAYESCMQRLDKCIDHGRAYFEGDSHDSII